MMYSKQALGIALASLALIGTVAVPAQSSANRHLLGGGEPLVAVDAVDATELQTNIPTDELLAAEDQPARLDTELVDDDAALAAATPFGKGLGLTDLVNAVARMQSVELNKEMRCLAGAIYNEARGRSIEGQLAVAQVVLNRAASSRWPSGLCDVIYQRYQFSYTFDGRPDYPARNANWVRAEAIAIIAVTGNWKDVTGRAVFFHATHANPNWKNHFRRTRRIGQHIFYR